MSGLAWLVRVLDRRAIEEVLAVAPAGDAGPEIIDHVAMETEPLAWRQADRPYPDASLSETSMLPLDRIHHALYVEYREQGEREASPSAAIMFSAHTALQRTIAAMLQSRNEFRPRS